MNRRKFLCATGSLMGITILNFGCGSDLSEWTEWPDSKSTPEPISSPTPEPISEPIEKTIVAEVGGQSFMSMNIINNQDLDIKRQIMAGTYSFPNPVAQVHCAGYGIVDSVDVGESVFRITEDHGYVYLACERRSIYRDIVRIDPTNYNFKFYKRLKRGEHQGAYDVKRLLGELVFVSGGEIYTDGYGTSKEWDREYYVKFAFECQDTAFVGGYSYENHCAGWFRSKDCLGWEWEDIGLKYSRFMQAAITEDQEFIYLVGTNRYTDDHNHNAATLWRYEVSSGILIQLWNFPGFDYIACIAIDPDDQPYFLLTRGWRSQETGVALVRWDGKPHIVTEFDKASEGRELIVTQNKIWCALRRDKVGGWIYEVPIN